MKFTYEHNPRPAKVHNLLNNVLWELVGQRIVNPGITVHQEDAIRYEQPGDHVRIVIPLSHRGDIDQRQVIEYAGTISVILNELNDHVDHRVLIEDGSLHIVMVAKLDTE